MDHGVRSPVRFFAPLALVAATLVFLVVLVGSLDGEDRDAAPTAPSAERAGGDRRDEGGQQEESYEIESGDTLDSIAAETGVSVERIQELNPDLDPQSLIAGQEITLSE